jgi:Trypsin
VDHSLFKRFEGRGGAGEMYTRKFIDCRAWLGLVVALGCTPDPGAASAVSLIARPVVNGLEATSCQWPSAVMVLLTSGLCTGTLVHPRLVTLAAHCQLAGTVRAIYLGETLTAPARKIDVVSCKFFPGFRANVDDVAFCVLSEEVKDLPIAPLLMGCETSILKKDKMLDLVGFGITSMHQPRSYGIKRWAAVPLLNTPGPGTNIAQVGTSSSNGCEGDSGGPIFVRLDDGTWRTVGVASTTAVDPQAQECVSPTNYVLLHRYAAWIESESGIDITPCHDADGRWNPSADCAHFSTAADTTTGTWDTSCNAPGAVSAGASSTCGAGTAAPATGETTGTADSGPAVPAEAGTEPPPPPAPASGAGPPSASDLDGAAAVPPRDATGVTMAAVPTLDPPAAHDAGCSCRLASRVEPRSRWWVLSVVALIALARRRRPRSRTPGRRPPPRPGTCGR